jgi:hypothetical protein
LGELKAAQRPRHYYVSEQQVDGNPAFDDC